MTRVAHTLTWVALGVAFAGSGCDTPASYTPSTGGVAPIQAPAQRPNFTADDEFWFDTIDGGIFVEVYAGTDDGLLTFDRGLQNEVRLYTPDLALAEVRRPFGSDEWFDPDDGALDFPLTPGKTWTRRYRVKSSDELETRQRSRSCEVLETGWVEVPAGRFAAYRIACTARELGARRATREEVFYAPAVGRIVLRRVLGAGDELRLIEFTRAAPE